MNKSLKSKILPTLKFVFAITLLVIVVWTLYRELSHIDFKKTLILLGEVDRVWLVILLVVGAASLLVLTLYDVVLSKVMKLHVPILKLLRVSYIINALNAVVGFGGFIGAGVRLMFYKTYTNETKSLVHTISLVLLSMLTGLSLLAILVATNLFDASHMLDKLPWVRWILYVAACFLPVFIAVTMWKPVNKENRLFGIYCTLISSVEWIAASAVLYLAFKIVGVDASFTAFVGIFIIAALAGLISFIPGGFGAFDLIILLGLKSLNVPEEKVLLGLLLYRMAYYFFPVIVALVISTFEFGSTARRYTLRYFESSKYFMPAKEVTSFVMSYQKDIITKVPAFALAVLVFFTSLIFFINNVSIAYNGIYDTNHLGYYIMLSAHTSACLFLMLNIGGIYQQSRRAILFTMISTVIILVIWIVIYPSLLLIGWLITLLALLFVAYRKALRIKRPFRITRIIALIVTSALILYLNQFYIQTALAIFDVYQIELDVSVLRYSFWLTIAVIILTVALVVWIYEKRNFKPHRISDIDICQNIVNQYGGNYLSHLLHSGDKECFIHESEKSFIMYRFKSGTFVVLGDPIGDRETFTELLESFYNYADRLGYDVIFYQSSHKYMSLYHSFGNQFFKLGEEALIDLTTFKITGKKRRAFRATLNKLEDLGVTFEVVEGPFEQDLFDGIQAVSDAWLDGRKEMHFSVGSFNYKYLNQAPIGIMKDADGKIIAFCSFMPVCDGESISVDLIRWLPDIDLPLMDALYLNMLIWAQNEGYTRFNMGMATLSNVGQIEYAYPREKIAGRIFEHFNGLYRFQGLRKYKEKFHPDWEPRFLVYRRHNSLWQSLRKVMKAIR